ncbi:hypothetical protein FOA52_000409 [Chlamydomonas sp. UWO 241]|nr:hypothetical protein FOA52_000409 [Chlamydomonas sp. UWO 241]
MGTLAMPDLQGHPSMSGFGRFAGLNAQERHVEFLSEYQKFYGGPEVNEESKRARDADKLRGTDLSALQAGHRFIRTSTDDAEATWEVKLASRYYHRLFKEYCIADLSRFKESKLGLRWRTEKEVVAGKGQFACGAKGCEERAGLCSYEVNFAYAEAGENKQALVKLRVCPSCAYKLNYKRERAYAKAAAAGVQGGRAGGKRKSGGGNHDDAQQQRSPKRAHVAAAEELLRRAAGGELRERPGAVAPPPARAAAAAADGGAGAEPQVSLLPGDDSVWEAKPAAVAATADEDFDQYLDDLFV